MSNKIPSLVLFILLIPGTVRAASLVEYSEPAVESPFSEECIDYGLKSYAVCRYFGGSEDECIISGTLSMIDCELGRHLM